MIGAVAMVIGCVMTAGALALVLGAPAGRDVVLGMLGPLVATAVSWLAVTRTHRRDPGAVMGVMLRAFAVKMVFFGAYVGVMLKVVQVNPVPFVVSFTGYFVTLYAVQALLMQRLTRPNAAQAPHS